MKPDSQSPTIGLPPTAPQASGMRERLRRALAHPTLNFMLTNAWPRRSLSRLGGRLSRIEHPWVSRSAIAIWRLFTDLDLSDARASEFASLHACFTRELRDGARPPDPDPRMLASPSDGLVGACGRLRGIEALQIKGSPYRLDELLGDADLARRLADGCYVTLRLTSAMYHHLHAPCDARVDRLDYVAGDAWNVNPPALARVSRLFCRNERAILRLQLAHDAAEGCRLAAEAPLDLEIVIVPVAAVLVAGMRFRFVDVHRDGPIRGTRRFDPDAPLLRGEAFGHFEHGSTVIVFAPRGFELAPGVFTGARIRAGQALMRRPG